MDEKRDNSGVVFTNNRKEKDTHPDRTGSATVGGVEYWVSGWIKQDRNGKQFLSLAFKPKEGPRHTPRRPDIQPPMGNAPVAPRPSYAHDPDDQIPFAPEWR